MASLDLSSHVGCFLLVLPLSVKELSLIGPILEKHKHLIRIHRRCDGQTGCAIGGLPTRSVLWHVMMTSAMPSSIGVPLCRPEDEVKGAARRAAVSKVLRRVRLWHIPKLPALAFGRGLCLMASGHDADIFQARRKFSSERPSKALYCGQFSRSMLTLSSEKELEGKEVGP